MVKLCWICLSQPVSKKTKRLRTQLQGGSSFVDRATFSYIVSIHGGEILFWKVFDSLEDWFLVISLGAMMILNFANVVSRYLLSTSIAFTEELTTNLFVWSCFIGAAAAAKRGAHLGFGLIVENMPPRARRIVTAFVTLLTLAMFALLFILSFDMIETQIMLKQETPALGMPEWVVSLAIPVGAFFCFVRFAQAGWNSWCKGGSQ